MANNNSDYTKPRTDLFELLPEVYQSDTNKSIINNLFNRFLTKQEVYKVAGYLGKGNPNAITKRQVAEPTLHRQAFQLQPIVTDKIGSIQHMSSWVDFSNELERLGVNVENINQWGELLQFNWVPPIDIDKLIHFEDYYWYNENRPNSQPEYITIRSRCATATANASFWESIVDEYGETIPIGGIGVVDDYNDIPTFDIVSISNVSNTIIVSGDASTELHASNLFNIIDSNSNDGIHTILSMPVYNDITNETTIPVVSGTLTTNELDTGTVTIRRFDKIILDGDYERLFDTGFVFFITNSTNVDLNKSFVKVSSVEYDEPSNITTVQITTTITDNTDDGVISLVEQLNLYLAERDCQCSGSVGWDLLQWDDNIDDPLWDGVAPGNHENLLNSITNNVPPSVAGVEGELWYDTSSDHLYQYDGTGPEVYGWKVLWNNFSLVVENTIGFALWDATPGCGTNVIVGTASQWVDNNMWLHKSDVPSFSIAKQAQYPILEYDWDLELNEWTYTDYKWKYRKDEFSTWEEVDVNPSLIELTPIYDWVENSDPLIDEIILDEKYGDLTSWFSVGAKFQSISVDGIFDVEYSTYVAESSGLPYQTRIRITQPLNTTGLIAGVTPLRPYRTSLDDAWKDYGDQWLFIGSNNTLPISHKTFNNAATIPSTDIPTIDTSGDFEYTSSYYAQSYTILTTVVKSFFDLLDTTPLGTSRSLRERALIGTDDVRVYVNDVRQYGTYNEIDDDNNGYVTGIDMLPGFDLGRFDQIRVELGEASPEDFGNYRVSVRMEEDNNQYLVDGNVDVSIIQFKKVEQIKSKTNQYPKFDIYNLDGSTANEANAIFGYKTDSSAEVNVAVGLRTVYDETYKIYDFDQFLIPEDNGKIYTYRDYSNRENSLWLNPITMELKFWTGLNWDSKKEIGDHYIPAVVSASEPSDVHKAIDGLYWVDSVNLKVFVRDVPNNIWNEETVLDFSVSDTTQQSIWKKGLNNETYVPDKVDWEGRSLEEYNESKELYVSERAEEIILADNTISLEDARIEATSEWNDNQSNVHSTNGVWVGDWEIPDPMYYNNQNENHKFIDSRELLTHFGTIIDSQPKIPGYAGPSESMFHLIASEDVNYGLGGKIKQYNDSFDTMLSAIFVNNVTPLSLISFAHDQYEALLNSIKEIYRKNVVSLLVDTTTDSLIDFSEFVADEVILDHETNDNAAYVYGDSTTYQYVDSGDNLGVKNWIATLPYVELVNKQIPVRIIDEGLGINQVVHHDGHRHDYRLTSATIENIIHITINTPDDRTKFPGPEDPATDTFGRQSLTDTPPNTVSEFANEFNTILDNREGVYWYYSPVTGTSTFYRLSVVAASNDEPSSSLPDGTTWMDLTVGSEVLRVKNTDPNTGIVSWDPVDGLVVGDGRLHNGSDPADVTTSTVSAWVEVNLDNVLGDTIFELENRLYENAPTPPTLRYDFDETENNNIIEYDQYTQQAFYDFTSQHEITSPLANLDYSSTLPFTWNYKFSTIGSSLIIQTANSDNNTFTVVGDVESSFSTTGSIFYIKNSGANDGTWTNLLPAVYDIGSDTTTIYVEEDVIESAIGTLYSGTLPSSRNDGSESGGDWRDFYQKVYGTPFPHLEPWTLQGYTNKPMWWDDEYLNVSQDDWGDRVWKYKHGFEIVGVDVSTDQFIVDGDFVLQYTTGTMFGVDGSSGINDGNYMVDSRNVILNANTGSSGTGSIEIAGNVTLEYPIGLRFVVADSGGNVKGTFTVKQRAFTGPPDNKTIILTEEYIGDVTDFDLISGGVYDSATKQTSIMVSSDLTVNQPGGRILIAFGMWENIRVGVIPAGQPYSNGVVSVTGIPATDSSVHNLQTPTIPTYNYFSVNIDNNTVSADGTVTFQPDDVLPPYWNFVGQFGGSIALFDRSVRSVFFSFGAEIVSPSANYSFGDAGPVEWEWSQSSQRLYDRLTTSFRLDPIKYISDTFGIDFTTIAGLKVDSLQEKVLCHCNTNFHGDILGSTPYLVNGSNQWYVNFNRHGGYDASFSDFRSLWTQWTAPLSYQYSSFIDTPSLSIAHRYVDVSEFDYAISSKKSVGVEDQWIDALRVSILSIPPQIARYDNQMDWTVEINTNLPISREIEYYDVQNYQFYADPETDLCTLSAWEVMDIDIFNSTFTVQGDQTTPLAAGTSFSIEGSTGNDGDYTVDTSVYNVVTDETIVDVNAVINSNIRDGIIVAEYRTLPWSTGTGIYLSSVETLPTPLQGDTSIGLTKYFIIVESDNTFKIANTRQDALDGHPINIASRGRRDHFVGAVKGTFQALNGLHTPAMWRHYEIDKRYLLTMTTPHNAQGLQTVVDIVDGYDIRLWDIGWRVNADSSQVDVSTGRIISWQFEIETFLDYAFRQRLHRNQVNDRYEVTADVATNEWTFLSDNSRFITGDTVNVFSSNSVYPDPFVRGIRYYMIRDSLSTFRLAASKSDASLGIAIDIISTIGTRQLYVMDVKTSTISSPTYEINPMRYSVWYRPKKGIISNVITGPSDDIKTTQLIFDQFGNPLDVDVLRIFREDKQTNITMIEGVTNSPFAVAHTPYNNTHLGGLHLFIDSYEHVLQFNNYTSDGVLIYDSFVGLNVTKFETIFNRMVEFTGRPNVGGYYLQTFFNQGADLKRNIEASIEDIRNLYDTHTVLETNPLMVQSRKVLGYEGTQEYLDELNLNPKSQFLFWKGQIQYKGSVNAMNAFVNSRRFIDAKVDEFWAIKIADYGSAKEKEYPELYVTTTDARSNDFRMQFVDDDDFCNAGYDLNKYDINECGYAYPNEGESILITDDSFTPIRITDDKRWYNQPDQLEILRDNGKNLYFDLEVVNNMPITIIPVGGTPPTDPQSNDGLLTYDYDSNTDTWGDSTFYRWDVVLSDWVQHGSWIGGSDESPAIRHGLDADSTTITVSLYPDGTTYTYTNNTGTSLEVDSGDSSGGKYIPYSGGITVFKGTNSIDAFGHEVFNGKELVEHVDYVDTLGLDDTTYSTTIILRVPLVETDVIKITHGTSTLSRGTQYVDINSNIIQFSTTMFTDSVDFPGLHDLTVWGLLVNSDAQNPAKLLDTKAEVVLANIQIWDPARNKHGSNAIHNVDLQNMHDPSFYSSTPELQPTPILGQPKVTPWGESQVGVTWLDTSVVDYIPYYDLGIFPDFETRLRSWGQLADWGNVEVSEWIESDIPPEEYDIAATADAGDINIPDEIRKSGNVRYKLFELSEDSYQITIADGTSNTLVFDDIDHEFASRLSVGNRFAINSSTRNDGTYSVVSISTDTTNETTIVTNEELSVDEEIGDVLGAVYHWVLSEVVYDERDAIIDGILDQSDNTYTIRFASLPNTLGDVYIDGKFYSHQSTSTDGSIIGIPCTAASRVRFIKFKPSTYEEIENGITNNTLLRSYEYTTYNYFDEFGLELTNYYFWVTNKSVKVLEKNRTLPINEVQQALVSGPSPYIIFQHLKEAGDVAVDGQKPIDRIELQSTVADQTVFAIELPIADNSAVYVVIDGVPLSDDKVSYLPGARKIHLDFNMIGGELVEIRYTGMFNDIVAVPPRYTQAIIRGLRGWIDADNRYTIRFTRDFTLRDDLDKGDSPLDLKNLHEEWQMFRQFQPYHVDRWLWDKITESMVGYELLHPNIRIPSYERQLYDNKYETDTQYGLGNGQAFTNGQMAIRSILFDLENPLNSFQPVDINAFFARNSFDTDEDIITTMDTIYNTFSFDHVNRMMFSIIHDAFSLKDKYPDLFKTSMVSLHGIKPFQVAGVFDD